MKISEFAKEVVAITPSIHAAVLQRHPNVLSHGRVTIPQMFIMEALLSKKECNMTELAKMLGVTKSAVTGVIDRLIKERLVQRSRPERDRRVVKIHLTEKGAQLSKKLRDFQLRVIADLFSNINVNERTQYLHILQKVQKNIRNKAGNK